MPAAVRDSIWFQVSGRLTIVTNWVQLTLGGAGLVKSITRPSHKDTPADFISGFLSKQRLHLSKMNVLMYTN